MYKAIFNAQFLRPLWSLPKCCHRCLSNRVFVPKIVVKCDRLWENPAKVARQNSEKKYFFLVKMPLWYILSIPKCKDIFRSALKLHLMSLRLIVFQYNSFIQTSKISKNHFFPRPTFQNVITHKIFEILWCPLHRIFCTWYRLIKHINIDIWINGFDWVLS
jgi:hypothetical protein